MEAQRIGTKYKKKCQDCNGVFWTDNKRVVYCSRSCAIKGIRKTWVKRCQQPQIKKKMAEHRRENYKTLKEKKLAYDIGAYFARTHEGRILPEKFKNRERKKGLRR